MMETALTYEDASIEYRGNRIPAFRCPRCGAKDTNKGIIENHIRRHGMTLAELEGNPKELCSEEENGEPCSKFARVKGKCAMHYQRALMAKKEARVASMRAV